MTTASNEEWSGEIQHLQATKQSRSIIERKLDGAQEASSIERYKAEEVKDCGHLQIAVLTR